jgi:uncharacterized protein YkwD
MKTHIIAVIVAFVFLAGLSFVDAHFNIGNVVLQEADSESVIAYFQNNQSCNLVGQLVYLTNAARAKGANCFTKGGGTSYYPPARSLRNDPAINAMAQKQANLIASRNKGGTFSLFHSTSAQLASNARSLGVNSMSENIWAGKNVSPTKSISSLLKSKDGHCQGMMRKNHSRLGVGVARGSNGNFVVVQQFV